MSQKKLVSIVVPAFNEALSFNHFYVRLSAALRDLDDYRFEIIIVDDGSHNRTVKTVVPELAQTDSRLRLIVLSRNFGKEAATTAGIHAAKGDAIITIDADGQHPVELLATLLSKWEDGARVVVGIRIANQNEGYIKRTGSKLFYRLFNKISGVKIEPNSTDYRLIDQAVQQDFMRMTERNRITRVLVDWLGYEPVLVPFTANAREHGEASYSKTKLIKLALDGMIAHSSYPLYFAAYLGLFILPLALLLGIIMVVDSLVGDPFNWQVTGSAYIVVLMLGLIGILLISQGIIGLYVSQIQSETKNRPLYIIDYDHSIRAD